jgi:hypothetical protein
MWPWCFNRRRKTRRRLRHDPPGNYDRLLDFSRAVTGTLFFVASATFVENVDQQS